MRLGPTVQDGMIATLFSTIPQPHRPIILDVRPMLHAWVDNIDNVHFGGASTDIVVRCLLHVILHWHELHTDLQFPTLCRSCSIIYQNWSFRAMNSAVARHNHPHTEMVSDIGI